MQRYFFSPKQIDGNEIIIQGDDVHHIKSVMRFQPGDTILLCDGEGFDYPAEIIQIQKEGVTCRIKRKIPSVGEPRLQITVAQSLPKGDKMDWVLQKGTELGVTSFFPFTSQHSIVQLSPNKAVKRLQRWQRIVKEAAEQSHRGRIPSVAPLCDWQGLLTEVPRFDQCFIAYEGGGISLTEALVPPPSYSSVLVIIGPEGGFSTSEIEQAKEAGAVPLSLGPRILRTETASLVLVTCLLYVSGDMEVKK